ncbi:helix-turn-helix domain-containing protein [Streptomyces sp. NPDC049954]|uniref:helix-turn-helix domain-containing protein n=1 Tax=Streptomyces sp. NPDC049954 TaxID=3155779 RepID=UPI003441B98E
MAKRRQQKGRRHRTVDRTPRPVSRTGAARRAVATAATPAGSPAGASAAATAPTTAPAPSATVSPAPSPTPPPASGGAGPGGRAVPGTELFAPASSGGLGRTAARTWQRLSSAGAAGLTQEELAERAGYQPATVAKHLSGLAERGLAERRGERWFPVTEAGVPA